jgi:hypothetical protein
MCSGGESGDRGGSRSRLVLPESVGVAGRSRHRLLGVIDIPLYLHITNGLDPVHNLIILYK